jgi:lipopolysaccharide biosynthesis glycosyltransferase
MKYLYVLVSNESDLYYEQALLSITSLRIKMPNAFISLLVDDKTAKTLTGNRSAIFHLITEFVTVAISPDKDNKERSRWLKTSMRNHIANDFLYIDCDTIIAGDLSDISNINVELGAVLDVHLMLQERFKDLERKKIHIERDEKIGFNSAVDKYFNSGVILCKDTSFTHDFFKLWHQLWQFSAEKGILEDQPSFSQANFKFNNVINELDGIWNCQIVRWGKQYLPKAKIIHYYNVDPNIQRPYIFANVSIYNDIKCTGKISNSTLDLLKYPRAAFTPSTKIRFTNNKKILKMIDSAFFFIYKKLWK